MKIKKLICCYSDDNIAGDEFVTRMYRINIEKNLLKDRYA